MVELREVRYRAGGALILDGISLRFRKNRFNVLLGPNGAGKTTLLKLAAGLLLPSAGEISYAGRSLPTFPAELLARKRAVLSQHVELAFPLAVVDVVQMGRYPHYGRVPSARDRDIVRRALDLVDMAGKSGRLYPTLSAGEQQKVQMARVLAQIWNQDEPEQEKYLFLDEPTTSLDIHHQIHLLDVARGLLGRNCTVIAILHDLNVALQYGDSFFVLDGGRLVHEADAAADVPGALIERVFSVRAHQLVDAEDGQSIWRFSLPDRQQ
jgi:iron complex transport system ATP-binding protein